MTMAGRVLEYYASPGPLTDLSDHGERIEALPDDVQSLAEVVHGLIIHQFLAEPFYGVAIPEARRQEAQIRDASSMIDAVLRVDDAPLSRGRPPEKRLAGICRNFGMLLAALLRAKGIAARSRFGFGGYFNPSTFEDHHVCEVWNAQEGRWILVDAQLAGDPWPERLGFAFDPLDVPRDQFVVSGEAWKQCRSGVADPSRFGTFNGNHYGLWFIAASLVRDVAALNKREMLQWDIWGAQPDPGAALSEEELSFFDEVAALTTGGEDSFEALCALYERDERLRVPQMVFNVMTNQPEKAGV